ncbi:MAG: hypothetical protein HY913_08845 [Desulfomonile tiedjei]|nr:hypothetical protein [Desulfomonile tiedjei]
MRPSGQSLSTVRSLLLLTTCLVFAGLVFTSQAAAQGAGAAPKPSPTVQTKETATGLIFEEMKFHRLLLSGRQYHITEITKFYGIDGKPINRRGLKRGDIVNVEYVTGGTAETEGKPYQSDDRRLTIVRVAPKAQR